MMERNAVWYTNGKGNNVKVLVCKDYDTLSKKAAGILAGIVNVKPNAVLGLATGSSPVGTYKELIKLNQEGLLDFSAVRTYNLDEYYPLDPSNDQSYHYFMNDNLFDHVNIDKNNVHVPDGNAADMNEACESYEAMLNEIGGVDIQVLGIGGNGHIGFNEPTDTFVGPTHVVELTESTIQANSRFHHESQEDPPCRERNRQSGRDRQDARRPDHALGSGFHPAAASGCHDHCRRSCRKRPEGIQAR